MQRATSKVKQIVNQLRALIDTHSFQEGCLPSEPDLARQLGTSRATIRQALAQLELDGIILRKQGVGTFVNERVRSIGTRLEEVWDFAEMLSLSGYTPGVRNVYLTLGAASPEVAQKLALNPGDEILTTANVFLADDIPVIYCVDVIPAGLVRSAYREEELHGPVYTFLKERCDQEVDYNITELFPVTADAQTSTLLHCQLGTPLHYFDEVAFNTDDIPIMCSKEYYRPAYFSFKVVRKMTTGQRTQ